MPSPAVSVRDVRKTYRTGLRRRPVHALRGVSLEVERGEVFGLLGPNGAGKSTLVKALLGIVAQFEGEAQILGRDVRRSEARRPVGYLPESHRFPSFLTARQMLDHYGALAGMDDAARRQRIPDLLDKVDLSERADTKVGTFSKGMMQRLGLAQALLNEPDLIVLDEPTDGVDPVGRRAIRDLLLELREGGVTIFLNSHLLSEVEQICTRVAILKDGELVRQGTVHELTHPEARYRLVATPLPDALLADAALPVPLDDLGPAPDAPGLRRYSAAAPDRAALNALLDALRAHDVEIAALEPLRRTLEESFVEVVTAPPAA